MTMRQSFAAVGFSVYGLDEGDVAVVPDMVAWVDVAAFFWFCSV